MQIMRPVVNKELQRYLSIVDEYYSSEAFANDQNLDREQAISLLSEKIKSAWHEAYMAADAWRDLVLSIRSKPWVQFVRNWEQATPQAYKVIVGMERGNNYPTCSIVVFVSFIGKQIGMLYVDMLAAESNNRPFYEYSRTSRNSLPVPFASYSPLNKVHAKYHMEILEEVNKFFPEFTFFENQFADYQVKGVQTEQDYYPVTYLWFFLKEASRPEFRPSTYDWRG